jgi:hypothetical protein
MHEFELGDWRSLLIHLLRMLDTLPSSRLDELDRRYEIIYVWKCITANCCSDVTDIGKFLCLAEIPYADSPITVPS